VHEQAFVTFFYFHDIDIDLMTFIYEPVPYLVEIYGMCENELCILRLL